MKKVHTRTARKPFAEECLVITEKPSYTLEALMNQCDFSQPLSVEEREWLDSPAVGKEII